MLIAEDVRTELDELALQVEQVFGNEQTVSGAELITGLEQLRKGMETATPDVIGAHYSYLRLKEQFSQMQLRSVWAKSHFWPLFGWQLAIFVGLLVLAGVAIAWLSQGTTQGLWLRDTAVACAWWGTVGASVAGLHALYVHRQNGTLTENLDAWLWAKQLLGGVLGLLTALVLQVTTVTTSDTAVHTIALPALVAFMAGFSERRFLHYLQSRWGQMLDSAKTAK